MSDYHVVDAGGYLGQVGTYNSPMELRLYRQRFGADAVRVGLPQGYKPGEPPPSGRHRWRVDLAAWEDPPRSAAELWAVARYQRDGLLTACDWRILPDSPTPEADRPAWLAYRQALRDVTDQPDPADITWPAQPS